MTPPCPGGSNGLPVASTAANIREIVSAFWNRADSEPLCGVMPEERLTADGELGRSEATPEEVEPIASAKQPAAVATLKIQVERALM
jgi:hypothetical protein